MKQNKERKKRQESQFCRNRKQNGGCQGLCGGGNEDVGQRVQTFGYKKNKF